MKVLNIKTKYGTDVELEVSDDVANLVMAKLTDPAVKSMIIKSLIQNRKESKVTIPITQPSRPCTPSESSSDSSSVSSFSSLIEEPGPSGSSVHHNWQSNEEDMLVSLRHEKQDSFMKVRNHTNLWQEICKELNAALKCNITATQALNKYNSLKKRRKEIVDAGTGTETKFFKQREAFDQMYGTRASTKPVHEIDTLQRKCEEDEESKHVKGKAKLKTNKRKSTQVLEILEKHNKEFHQKVTEIHEDKMKRLDRLLDLYEEDITSRKKPRNTDD